MSVPGTADKDHVPEMAGAGKVWVVMTGKILFLRVSAADKVAGGTYGPPGDFLNTEVVVVVESHPDTAAGFYLKSDPNLPSRLAMLSALREAYVHGLNVGCGCFVEAGKHTGELVRVDIGV